MFKGVQITPENDYLESRKVLLLNNDLKMGLAKPKKSTDYFYKNAECDELLFVHEGKGTLKTFVGNLDFEKRRLPYHSKRNDLSSGVRNYRKCLFFLEAHSPIYTPKDTEMSSGNCWNIPLLRKEILSHPLL